MTRAKRCHDKLRQSSWADKITQETFKGLNIHSIGSEPSIRNAPLPTGSPHECKQKVGRETLRKVENDMTRNLLNIVSKALDNQIKLPFYVSEFEEERTKGIPVSYPSAFRELAEQPRRLTVAGGPAVVTDLAGVPVLWYFPQFIGTGLRTNLMSCITELAQVYRPPPDVEIKDRRATTQDSGPGVSSLPNPRYMTRSQTTQTPVLKVQEVEIDQNKPESPIGCSERGLENRMAIPDDLSPPEPYKDFEGGVHLDGHYHDGPPNSSESPSSCRNHIPRALADYAPFAYYFSPGWCQTGMQYVRPIQMSVHFRNALSQGLHETIGFLEAKRLLDKQITLLTEIIQPSLSNSMCQLRTHMSAVEGPTRTAVVTGWTSAFPCFGVAINRVTGMHRDTKGIRAGLDIIGILGTFTDGGDLELPDLNLRLEWMPGCLGAFDGYDFRHKEAHGSLSFPSVEALHGPRSDLSQASPAPPFRIVETSCRLRRNGELQAYRKRKATDAPPQLKQPPNKAAHDKTLSYVTRKDTGKRAQRGGQRLQTRWKGMSKDAIPRDGKWWMYSLNLHGFKE
ncbi:hypothetical protein FRC11_005328 [Ceratobasidium sp. 423]|nr:hypothetical protein FRC11_005328 [Ceratobasidium sp. 423]